MRDRRDVISEESQIAALRKFDQAFETAIVARDLDAVTSAFWPSQELIVFPPLGPMELRGITAVQDYYERLLKMDIVRFEHFEAHYQLLGDCAVGWGKWRLVVQEKKKHRATEGRYTAVYGLIHKHWRYIIQHSSVPATGA